MLANGLHFSAFKGSVRRGHNVLAKTEVGGGAFKAAQVTGAVCAGAIDAAADFDDALVEVAHASGVTIAGGLIHLHVEPWKQVGTTVNATVGAEQDGFAHDLFRSDEEGEVGPVA